MLYEKPVTSGMFVDSTGRKHRWYINQSHALIWNEEPYVPFGFGVGDTYTACPVLKEHGITDVLVYNFFGTLFMYPSELQRTIDTLEQYGFNYGIGINLWPLCPPLTSFIVNLEGTYPRHPRRQDMPADFKVSGIKKAGIYTKVLPLYKKGVPAKWIENLGGKDYEYILSKFQTEVNFVLYAFTDITDDSTKPVVGTAKIDGWTENGLEVYVEIEECKTNHDYTITFVPNVTRIGYGWPVSDFWVGEKEIINVLKENLPKIKFGSGLRFFVDPLVNEIGLTRPPSYTLPTSRKYRREFASWLQNKYKTVDNAVKKMGSRSSVPDFDVLASLIPICQEKNVYWLYSPLNGECYSIPPTRFWSDVMRFQGESIRKIMNRITRLVKSFADVPVINKHLGREPLEHLRATDMLGFDGVGVDSYGGQNIRDAAPFYAEAENAEKTTLIFGTEVDYATFVKSKKGHVGYSDVETAFRDWNDLLSLGVKGMFLHIAGAGLWFPDVVPDYLEDPKQLDWLRKFKEITYSAIEKIVDYEPSLYYYYPLVFGRGGYSVAGETHVEVPKKLDNGVLLIETHHFNTSTRFVVAHYFKGVPLNWVREYGALEKLFNKGIIENICYIGLLSDTKDPLFGKYLKPLIADDNHRDEEGRLMQEVQIPSGCKAARITRRLANGLPWALIDDRIHLYMKEKLSAQEIQKLLSDILPDKSNPNLIIDGKFHGELEGLATLQEKAILEFKQKTLFNAAHTNK